MSVSGYLDTIDMIFNQQLHHIQDDLSFDVSEKIASDNIERIAEIDKAADKTPNEFYETIVNNFLCLYKELLLTSGKDPEHDKWLKTLLTYNSRLAKYYIVREMVNSSNSSKQALALTTAVEIQKGEITMDETLQLIRNRSDYMQFSLFNRKSLTNEDDTRINIETLFNSQVAT
jgi:hypothetical protein